MLDTDETPELGELMTRAHEDPNVAGVLLTVSAGRTDMLTEHSDVDVIVALRTADTAWSSIHSPAIDQWVCTLDELRVVPGPDDPDGWWGRFAFAHATLLLDRSEGEFSALVERWGTLSGSESKQVLETQLDGYVNFIYRSLKSLRDGRTLEARLDAAESLSWGLAVIFAFERRVRPYNKYLPWELRNHPLSRPAWQADVLLPRLDAILRDAEPAAQRAVYTSVEEAAYEVGLGGIIDAWDHELPFIRGGQVAE